MFKKLVLATDLSPAWEEIIACAGELKALGAEELILTHVVTVKFLVGLEATIRAEAEPKLAAQKEQLQKQGFRVSVELPSGLPAYALNEVAERHHADLLVVGPQKTSRWQERILGSVASAVLHHARYPVLLLKSSIREELEAGVCRLQATELLRHVLFPTDFSMASERAGYYLKGLAGRGVQRVTVLHALDVPGGEAYPPGFQEMAEAQARESLAAVREQLLQAGFPQVEAVFDPGHPLSAILKVLETHDISLIVMGTLGKGFIKELFLGSVAHNVARLAPCPVLLIPPASR
jgi:nucleotide-binding universal stress UspA family protein|uniref:Universal stress protein n=1 Tax=Desulfobacca acetoxidans TaxID=60893 RepID=A0A7C3WS38_9BACT